MLQTEILGKYNSSFRWSKLPSLQMHRKLGFIWKTYAQPAIGVIGIPPGPPEVCPTQSPPKPALFCPVQGCLYKHRSAPRLTLEKIWVSRGEARAQPFGRTLYDNNVYGNWIRPKGIGKVSGILEGSDFNMKSVYERLRKVPRRKD